MSSTKVQSSIYLSLILYILFIELKNASFLSYLILMYLWRIKQHSQFQIARGMFFFQLVQSFLLTALPPDDIAYVAQEIIISKNTINTSAVLLEFIATHIYCRYRLILVAKLTNRQMYSCNVLIEPRCTSQFTHTADPSCIDVPWFYFFCFQLQRTTQIRPGFVYKGSPTATFGCGLWSTVWIGGALQSFWGIW